MAKFLGVALLFVWVLFRLSESAAIEKGFTVKDLKAIVEQCENQTDDGQSAGSLHGNCEAACILKMSKVMNENGKYDKSVAMNYAADLARNDPVKLDTFAKIIDVCAEIAVPEDHCEAANAIVRCLTEQSEAHAQ